MQIQDDPEVLADQWAEQFFQKLQGQRYPLAAQFELTERCNFNCVHCYINQPANCKKSLEKELTTVQAIEVLDKMADAGTLFLVFTGGEPLLRPDFPEIYKHAIKRGLFVTLFTNATMLTEPIADLLAEWRPHIVDISIYGVTRETYEKVTRLPGSFERAMQGIQRLQERQIRFFLKTIVMTINQHELLQMKAFADSLGHKFRYDGNLWPRLDGDRAPLQYQISIEDLIALDKIDLEREQEWCHQYEMYAGKMLRAEYVYSCGAGIHGYHVDSFGGMSICGMSRYPSYDLLHMDFVDIWENLGLLRARKRQKDTPCRSCLIGALCNLCPGLSRVMHGDEEAPVNFVCALAHKRFNELQYISDVSSEEIEIYE